MKAMRCAYFETEQCRSCPEIQTPYRTQLADKDAATRHLLRDHVPDAAWHPIVASQPDHFRTKVKLAVGGTALHPSLGFIESDATVTDIRLCPIQDRAITTLLPELSAFIARASLTPYDVAARSGELKYLLITVAPTGQAMLRFVLRSREAEARIRKHLPALLAALPQLAVVSINLLPQHKAVTEGDQEIPLTSEQLLPVPLPGLTLFLPPKSFIQTNTQVASELYQTAATLVDRLSLPERSRIYDLYCGIGGFALSLAGAGRAITGVEISAPAIEAATRAAALLAPRAGQSISFVAGDALSWARQAQPADLVVVNPPRRGIGAELAQWLNTNAPAVLYSSCNAASLASDLAHLPRLRPVYAQVFDMFPHTRHTETLVLLQRED